MRNQDRIGTYLKREKTKRAVAIGATVLSVPFAPFTLFGSTIAAGAALKKSANAVSILEEHYNNASPENREWASKILDKAFADFAKNNGIQEDNLNWHTLLGEQRIAKMYAEVLKALDTVDKTNIISKITDRFPEEKEVVKGMITNALIETLLSNLSKKDTKASLSKSATNRLTNIGSGTRYHISFKEGFTKDLGRTLQATANNMENTIRYDYAVKTKVAEDMFTKNQELMAENADKISSHLIVLNKPSEKDPVSPPSNIIEPTTAASSTNSNPQSRENSEQRRSSKKPVVDEAPSHTPPVTPVAQTSQQDKNFEIYKNILFGALEEAKIPNKYNRNKSYKLRYGNRNLDGLIEPDVVQALVAAISRILEKRLQTEQDVQTNLKIYLETNATYTRGDDGKAKITIPILNSELKNQSANKPVVSDETPSRTPVDKISPEARIILNAFQDTSIHSTDRKDEYQIKLAGLNDLSRLLERQSVLDVAKGVIDALKDIEPKKRPQAEQNVKKTLKSYLEKYATYTRGEDDKVKIDIPNVNDKLKNQLKMAARGMPIIDEPAKEVQPPVDLATNQQEKKRRKKTKTPKAESTSGKKTPVVRQIEIDPRDVARRNNLEITAKDILDDILQNTKPLIKPNFSKNKKNEDQYFTTHANYIEALKLNNNNSSKIHLLEEAPKEIILGAIVASLEPHDDIYRAVTVEAVRDRLAKHFKGVEASYTIVFDKAYNNNHPSQHYYEKRDRLAITLDNLGGDTLKNDLKRVTHEAVEKSAAGQNTAARKEAVSNKKNEVRHTDKVILPHKVGRGLEDIVTDLESYVATPKKAISPSNFKDNGEDANVHNNPLNRTQTKANLGLYGR
jgi:hypothetical protein